ncbi:glycine betaine ABC transporter substrate-binding protein [Paeniglutamicibacter gangotriensis]|uniref:Substrate binding domain of ABC-type glycine betaine transport system n=1 Tax=Paeniglutamicibacter gangotriensis Lz1y TaxID=1276920 RepID=M7NCQ9_9MICC|nr:glycine betaine ABC transporter substrate-binding protein [Paeniglutamicibacter gangotriensis]EMQ99604.1 Substrate binding domain of ABC-type glycine betaine transport system [Paeniglutamicibacter gangotriensis Lz1y]
MIRSTGPLGLTAIGALLLSLTACTAGSEVDTSQPTTTRELVIVQGPDAQDQALGHAYRQMLDDAGIEASLAKAADDPVAAVLAGHADVTVAGSGELLAALEKLPSSAAESSPAADSPAGTSEDLGRPESTSGATALDAAQTKNTLHALQLSDFAVLDSAEAQSTGTLVVTAATSAGEQLTNVQQLSTLCSELEFGIVADEAAQLTDELATILDCVPAKVIELTAPNARGVLPVITDAVQVQATTVDNAGIADNALVVLEGADVLFAPQTITPLITTREVGQDAVKALNKLSGALKQEDLLELDRMVTGRDAVQPARAASDWLAEKDMLDAG